MGCMQVKEADNPTLKINKIATNEDEKVQETTNPRRDLCLADGANTSQIDFNILSNKHLTENDSKVLPNCQIINK